MSKNGEQRVFIDTSAWIALFLFSDQNHLEAVEIFEKIEGEYAAIFTSNYVFDETVTFMMRRAGQKAAVEVGDAILGSQLVKVEFVSFDQFYASWDSFKKYDDKEFSFTDVTSFQIMHELNIRRAFSFDRHFEQAGFERIVK